jgi:hypothetical protein
MRRAVDTLPDILSETVVKTLPPADHTAPPSKTAATASVSVLREIRRLVEDPDIGTWETRREKILAIIDSAGIPG